MYSHTQTGAYLLREVVESHEAFEGSSNDGTAAGQTLVVGTI